MFKKIVVGVAIVALSLGVALPASAQTKTTDVEMTAMAPGIFCIWFGWC